MCLWRMKTILMGATLLLLVGCGDNEQSECLSKGKIIARDMTVWSCGGGWLLETGDGDTINVYFNNALRLKLESWPEEAMPINVTYSAVTLPASNACNEFSKDLVCLDFVEEP